MHKDQVYISAFVRGDSLLIQDIYDKSTPLIKNLVLNNSGSHYDFEEIHQRAIVALYELSSRKGDLILTCQITSLVYGIARNLWLKVLRKKDKQVRLTEDHEVVLTLEGIDFHPYLEADLIAQRHLLFWRKFELLDDDCKKTLDAYMEGKTHDEIANIFKIKTSGIKVKKYRCLRKLEKMIKTDPRYDELKFNV